MATFNELREFTEHDWFGFAGCETKDPKIGGFTDSIGGEWIVIVDGSNLGLYLTEKNYDNWAWLKDCGTTIWCIEAANCVLRIGSSITERPLMNSFVRSVFGEPIHEDLQSDSESDDS